MGRRGKKSLHPSGPRRLYQGEREGCVKGKGLVRDETRSSSYRSVYLPFVRCVGESEKMKVGGEAVGGERVGERVGEEEEEGRRDEIWWITYVFGGV